MRFLRQNTATIVSVGPFYDKTDGVTIETGLTITNERITLVADTDDGSAPTNILDNVTGATSGTANDLNYITGNDAGMMQLELSAANINRVGRLLLSITDAANHVPVFHEFTILPAVVYDAMIAGTDNFDVNVAQFGGTNLTAASGRPEVNLSHIAGSAVSTTTAQLGVNVVQVSADSTAADNLEAAFDGAGYAGGTIPQVVAISSSDRAAIVDAVFDEAFTDHKATGSFGSVFQPTTAGTAAAGGASTITLSAPAVASANYYNKQLLKIVAGTGIGQSEYIDTYSVGRVATMAAPWVVVPDNTSVYVIDGGGTIPGASAPSAADNAAAVWNALISAHGTEASFGAFFQAMHVHAGTSTAATSNSITLDGTGSSGVDNTYNYQFITIRDDTGVSQTRQIIDYDGSTKVATVNLDWATNPSASDYVIHPGGLDAVTVATVATGVWAATRAANGTAGSFGEYVNADVLRLSNDATAADNAESFFDGTGYAGTGNVIPSVTTVTGNVNGNVSGSVANVLALAANVVSAAAIAADAVTELQAGIATAANLATAKTAIDAIKAKTDSLAFSVAGLVDANVQSINGTEVVGDGSAGDPWAPV
jgi:hypothetical protein